MSGYAPSRYPSRPDGFQRPASLSRFLIGGTLQPAATRSEDRRTAASRRSMPTRKMQADRAAPSAALSWPTDIVPVRPAGLRLPEPTAISPAGQSLARLIEQAGFQRHNLSKSCGDSFLAAWLIGARQPGSRVHKRVRFPPLLVGMARAEQFRLASRSRCRTREACQAS
jgi:hypothetical protein